MGSSSVSFWSVQEFAAPVLQRVGRWPLVGTPEWCQLPADHEAKLAALLDAARHHALRLELNQEARAEASRDISGAADWPKVGRELQRLCEFRRTAPWSKRVPG